MATAREEQNVKQQGKKVSQQTGGLAGCITSWSVAERWRAVWKAQAKTSKLTENISRRKKRLRFLEWRTLLLVDRKLLLHEDRVRLNRLELEAGDQPAEREVPHMLAVHRMAAAGGPSDRLVVVERQLEELAEREAVRPVRNGHTRADHTVTHLRAESAGGKEEGRRRNQKKRGREG